MHSSVAIGVKTIFMEFTAFLLSCKQHYGKASASPNCRRATQNRQRNLDFSAMACGQNGSCRSDAPNFRQTPKSCLTRARNVRRGNASAPRNRGGFFLRGQGERGLSKLGGALDCSVIDPDGGHARAQGR